MSVEAMAIVLHHSRGKGTVKLVMIGIANHEGDGGSWPTVATLAKYANVHPRNVQKALDRLVSLGEIHVEYQVGGTANLADCERPNLYSVTLRCPTWCDGSSRHRDMRKRAGAQLSSWHGPQPVDKGVAHSPPGGAFATGGGGAFATGGGGAFATQTTLGNHPSESGVAATVTSWVDKQLAAAAQLGPCAECSQPAARCMVVPERVSGHRYRARA